MTRARRGLHTLRRNLDRVGQKADGGEKRASYLFGSSVALSSEGNTVIVSGFDDHASMGAAWRFTRSGSTWVQLDKKLVAGEQVGEGEFGYRAWRRPPTAKQLYSWAAPTTTPNGRSRALTYESRPAEDETERALRGTDFRDPQGNGESRGRHDEQLLLRIRDLRILRVERAMRRIASRTGSSPVAVEATLPGLTPSTTYDYRLVAANEVGPVRGLNVTFTTTAAKLPEVGRCRKPLRHESTGKYKSSTCTTKSAGEDTGKYEWQPGPRRKTASASRAVKPCSKLRKRR